VARIAPRIVRPRWRRARPVRVSGSRAPSSTPMAAWPIARRRHRA
jgi:hypothetical protein